MFPSISVLRTADASAFAAYLACVTDHLAVEPSLLPDGVGECIAAHRRVNFALRRDIGFAAFRWAEGESGCDDLETFFVTPMVRPPHTATIVRPRFLDTTIVRPAYLDRWTAAVPGAEIATNTSVPSFWALLALLASDGRCQSNNGDLLQANHALESELFAARETAADLARDLQIAQENLRLAHEVREQPSEHNHPGSHVAQGPGLDQLPAWATQNADRIVVLPRALQSAKKSKYESPETVMGALEFLAGTYRDHRRGEICLADFEASARAQPFQIANSVSASVAGEQGEQYYVRWAGHRVFMNLKVQKGGGRDPRYALRIYFFWDSETRRVIVGSLTHHLENSLS